MTFLAIETSTTHGRVSVVRDGAVIFGRAFISERSHNSQLFAPLSEALAECRDDLQGIVVGLGPGSYTGVRIGIAAAQGLAMSSGVAVFGLPSVLAPDAVELPPDFIVCGDARRGTYFAAGVSNGALVGEISLHDAAALTSRRESDTSRVWFSFDDQAPLNLPAVRLVKPSASLLAKLASVQSSNTVPQILEPIYLAGAFITQPKQRG